MMKALAEQISELDGVEDLRPRRRRARADGGGRRPAPRHVGRRPRSTIETGRRTAASPARWSAFPAAMRWRCRSRARRRAARLPRGGRQRRRPVRPSDRWLGRVVNAMGEPIDGKGPLPPGPAPYPFRNSPPPAHARRRVGAPLDLGVRALNTFLTCCRGQRMGIFSGSGVGKSVLLSMLARNVAADISVIGLVGERGREVQEFLQDDLGRSRPRPLGGGGLDLRRAGADAPPGGLSDARHRRIFPRPRARTCWC